MSPRRTPKPDPLEQALAKVHALRDEPDSETSRAVLAQALENPRNAVVAAAAQIISELELRDFTPALARAFDRLMHDPVKSDPICKGKIAIASALLALDSPDSAVFLAGIRHRQSEPVYGGSVDTAPELRGISALGLLRTHHPDAPMRAAECLADPEAIARAGAAHALGELNAAAALPLLRFKLAIGDDDPGVVGACFRSLLDHAPQTAFELAPGFLTADSEGEGEAVALALGESRKPDSFALLRDYAARADASGRAVAFVALTLLRDDQATAYLVDRVAAAPIPVAADAIRALANFRHDPRLRAQVLAATRARKDSAVSAAAHKAFEEQ